MICTRQLYDKESSTYTYLIFDDTNQEAFIIDPVREQIERDSQLIKELGLNLYAILETHVHADHVTSAALLKEKFGANVFLSGAAGVKAVHQDLKDGDVLTAEHFEIRAIETPGHTNGCMSFYVPEAQCVFTGDALMIRKVGRTDFQEGSAETLFESITTKLFTLPLSTIVYPAHDYSGQTSSTIREEITHNIRIGGKTKEEFVEIMNGLNLPRPKKMDEAVPANLQCGNII